MQRRHDKAIEYLREKAWQQLRKKAGRIAEKVFLMHIFMAAEESGVLVEVNMRLIPLPRTKEFRSFVKDIAMQIAASNPQYVRREEVPEEVI